MIEEIGESHNIINFFDSTVENTDRQKKYDIDSCSEKAFCNLNNTSTEFESFIRR